MSPIGKSRKPAWEHKDPARRADAVARSDDAALIAALPDIASRDTSAEVRLAAVSRLEDQATLLGIAARDADESVRARASERALQCALESDEFPAGGLAPLLESCGEAGRMKLLREAAAPALRRRLLDDVTDQALLAERVLKDSDRDVQREALSRLDDVKQLKRVEGALKRRRQKLHRDAAERLERLLVESGDPDAVSRRAETLALRLENMARTGDMDPGRRDDIAGQWRHLPESGRAPFQARFEGALRILEQAANPSPRPEPAAPDPEPAADTPEPSRALEHLAHEAELLAQQEQPSTEAEEALQRSWRKKADHTDMTLPAAAELERRFTSALDRARHRREKTAEQVRDRHDAFAASLDELEQCLDNGDLHGAREADHGIKQHQAGETRPTAAQSRRLAAAHRRLHELRDWQHWANNKVRHRLCEEVEALPTSDLHPDAVLQALKAAQKEWRELEDSEKLTGETRAYRASGQGLWKRFQAAGKRAFAHAKPFLEKRSELRQAKLEEVRALIGELEALERADDAGNPRDLAKKLSLARRSLARLEELPPQERGAVARSLRHALNVHGKRLDAEREQLGTQKQALIDEAAALDPESDLQGAVRDAKQLMRRWKNLGTLPRGRERKLWTAFRGHLDPVFEKRDAAQADVKRERAAEDDALEALCREVERLAGLPGTELEAASSDLNRVRGQWQSRRQRPRHLEARFRQALDEYRHRLAEHRANRRLESVRSLFLKARLCRRLERGELDMEKVRGDWDELPELPDSLERRMDDRLKQAMAKQGDTAGDVEELQRLVLSMELISGVDSPAELEQERMELKVMRLNQSMRGERERLDPEQEMETLLAEWAAAPGTLPRDQSAGLEERVARALEAFHGASLKLS